MLIVPGPASKELAARVATKLPAPVCPVDSKYFPDGESYVRIAGEVRGDKVAIIQSTYPPQDKHLIELFALLSAAKDMGAKFAIAVVPYLAYARQDKRFEEGEPITARTILQMIETAGADCLITVNVHKEDSLRWLKIPYHNVCCMGAMGNYLRQLNPRIPLVLAPDRGALELAQRMAKTMDAESNFLEKTRNRETGNVMTVEKDLGVKGRDVVIVDDVISTGSSVSNAAKICKRQGAAKTLVACAHALLANSSRERLKEAGVDSIVGTDTIPSDLSRVTVSDLIAEVLRKYV